MSATSSTEATLLCDAADTPLTPPAERTLARSPSSLHTSNQNNGKPLNLTTPSRPSLKRSATSIRQRQSISNKNHVDTRGSNGRPALDAPRSFQQLFDEQAYLIASQATQEQRSRELMRRLAALQDILDGESPQHQRRRSKKQASLLKAKLAEAAEQERAILGRLGEVFVELQNRQRWMQAQQERHVSSWLTLPPWTAWKSTDSPVSSVMTPMVLTPRVSPLLFSGPLPGTQLDAESPEFVPMRHFQLPSNDSHQRSCTHPRQSKFDASHLIERSVSGLGHEMADHPALAEMLGNCNLLFEYDDTRTLEDDSLTSQEPEIYRTRRGKRRSVPCLKCVWPGTEVVEASKGEAGGQEHTSQNGR